jgi:hypothetical protein
MRKIKLLDKRKIISTEGISFEPVRRFVRSYLALKIFCETGGL